VGRAAAARPGSSEQCRILRGAASGHYGRRRAAGHRRRTWLWENDRAAARAAFLIGERGFDPSTILVVSFTTEAARRLRREVARQLGDRAADVAILTLHALGRRVIDT